VEYLLIEGYGRSFCTSQIWNNQNLQNIMTVDVLVYAFLQNYHRWEI